MSKKRDELKPIKKKTKELKEIKDEMSVLSELDEHDIRYRCGCNIETYNTLRFFRLKKMQKRQGLKDGETIIADEPVMKLAPGFEFNDVKGEELEKKIKLKYQKVFQKMQKKHFIIILQILLTLKILIFLKV